MDLLVLGNCFAALVAPILLYVLARKLLQKRRASAPRNAEDPNPGAPTPSIPPIESHYEYDVFLSFRGIDTRRSFTDQLHSSLVNAGIAVYEDDDELRVGEKIYPKLSTAIKNSKILIPIISDNYASSRWCLQELVHMMDCKKSSGNVVLPIFYKLKPTDVQYQTGNFGEAFHYYHSRRNFDQNLVEKWKQALREVSCLPGLESEKVAYRQEGELIEWIVRKVLDKLTRAVKFNLVGIDSHVKHIMELVNQSPNATLYVGICGLGGIGKTTLAKAIYNELFNLFEHHSFIEEIRESCKANGLKYLQNKLISDILGEDICFYYKEEGIEIISSNFKDKKVLIVLDDVDETDQLKALAGNRNWFAPGSRIFVTTRDRNVLVRPRMDTVYEHKEMDMVQSLILFSRHAFQKDYPPAEFATLSRHVLSITGGLPLALQVVGSFLYKKGEAEWMDTIEKMQILPHSAIQDKLMVGFEALERDQKQIFLDIACFLIKSDARVASYMWDACGFYTRVEIDALRSRSFIKIGDNHELKMHDQLRDLGREIVCKENKQDPQYRSRLWDYKEALEVLVGKKGTKKIEAIYLEKGNSARTADEDDSDYVKDQGSHIFTGEQFENLPRLRFLHMSNVNLAGDFEKTISRLKWLKWGSCSPTFKAINFHPKELVILDLSGSLISNGWQGWSSMTMAKGLKVLNLTACRSLKDTSFLSDFKKLEILIFRDCSELEQIDSCIGDLVTLVSLDLSRCLRLKNLPPQVGKLEQLKELLVDQTMIGEIPSFIGFLKKLEMLSAKDCKFLLRLPRAIGHLVNLSTLVLSGCVKLVALPDTIGDLQNLGILNISHTEIEELPNGIGKLRKLRDLDASRCTKLRGEAPKSICNLSSLQRLNFHGCKELLSLPELPSSLTYLSLTCQIRCGSFLPASLKLKILQIFDCKFMELLDVSQLRHLQKLSVVLCNNLLEVRGLDKLKYLESLTITDCDLIERLEHSKSGESSLKYIAISGCSSMEILPDLSSCTNLISLVVQNCKKLTELQGLEKLEQLVKLDISGCKSLKTKPELSRMQLYQNEQKKPFDSDHGMLGFGEDDWNKSSGEDDSVEFE